MQDLKLRFFLRIGLWREIKETEMKKAALMGSFLGISGGPDGARTRDLRRDRPAF